MQMLCLGFYSSTRKASMLFWFWLMHGNVKIVKRDTYQQPTKPIFQQSCSHGLLAVTRNLSFSLATTSTRCIYRRARLSWREWLVKHQVGSGGNLFTEVGRPFPFPSCLLSLSVPTPKSSLVVWERRELPNGSDRQTLYGAFWAENRAFGFTKSTMNFELT